MSDGPKEWTTYKLNTGELVITEDHLNHMIYRAWSEGYQVGDTCGCDKSDSWNKLDKEILELKVSAKPFAMVMPSEIKVTTP